MKLRRWTRMSGSVLLIAMMGMNCVGCFDPETESEFIDQPRDFTKVSAGEDATPGKFLAAGGAAHRRLFARAA